MVHLHSKLVVSALHLLHLLQFGVPVHALHFNAENTAKAHGSQEPQEAAPAGDMAAGAAQQDEDEWPCIVCSEPEPDVPVVQTRCCGKRICTGCVRGWLQRGLANTCPHCKRPEWVPEDTRGARLPLGAHLPHGVRRLASRGMDISMGQAGLGVLGAYTVFDLWYTNGSAIGLVANIIGLVASGLAAIGIIILPVQVVIIALLQGP